MQVEYLQFVDWNGKFCPWEKMYKPDSLDGKYLMVEVFYKKGGISGFDDRRGYYITLRIVERKRNISNGNTITTNERILKSNTQFYAEAKRYSKFKEDSLMDKLYNQDCFILESFASENGEEIDW